MLAPTNVNINSVTQINNLFVQNNINITNINNTIINNQNINISNNLINVLGGLGIGGGGVNININVGPTFILGGPTLGGLTVIIDSLGGGGGGGGGGVIIFPDPPPPFIPGGGGGDVVVVPPPQELIKQTSRSLNVLNDTGEAMTIYVQYCSPDEATGEFAWFPADPNGAENPDLALSFDIKAGEELALERDGVRVYGSRCRIWGVTASGRTLEQFRNQDLWLVPEVDENGDHYYFAQEMQTFQFVFTR